MDTTARRLFTPEPHGQSPTEPTADHRAAVPVASGAWVEEFVFRFLLVFFVFLLPRRFARKTNAGTQRNRLCKLFLIDQKMKIVNDFCTNGSRASVVQQLISNYFGRFVAHSDATQS